MARMIPILVLAAAVPGPAAEPDGSRPVGIVPPFLAQDPPPAWLRGLSQALADARGGGTRHYLYEAYGDGAGAWLVRFLRLPAAGEDPSELQVAFLFGTDPLAEPRLLDPGAIEFVRRTARWEACTFTLADRRDLLRPRAPSCR
jgi:hypothetical protein